MEIVEVDKVICHHDMNILLNTNDRHPTACPQGRHVGCIQYIEAKTKLPKFLGQTLIENIWISINISLNFLPKDPMNKIPALLKVIACSRPGDKPFIGPVRVSLLMHICISQLKRVNYLFCTSELLYNMQYHVLTDHLNLRPKYNIHIFFTIFIYLCSNRKWTQNFMWPFFKQVQQTALWCFTMWVQYMTNIPFSVSHFMEYYCILDNTVSSVYNTSYLRAVAKIKINPVCLCLYTLWCHQSWTTDIR